jgi:hypothetical protein
MGVVCPPGFKFGLKGVEGQTHDVVESMRYHAAQIYMNVLAGFLHLAEKVTGSYATGETLSDFFNLAENSTAEMIAEEINLSVVRRLVDYNYELPHALRIDRMPYPLLKPAKIAVLNPIKLFESIRWLMQDNTDAIQPSDALENKLLELAGLPAKEKARPRFRAIAQTVREAEKAPGDTIPDEPGGGEIPKQENGGIPKQEPETLTSLKLARDKQADIMAKLRRERLEREAAMARAHPEIAERRAITDLHNQADRMQDRDYSRSLAMHRQADEQLAAWKAKYPHAAAEERYRDLSNQVSALREKARDIRVRTPSAFEPKEELEARADELMKKADSIQAQADAIGHWVTIDGRPVFIQEGSLTEERMAVMLTEPVKFPPYSRTGRNKINLRAQSSKAESTARRVAETLRSRKSAWLDELHRMLVPIDRSDRRHGLALEHDRDAAGKIATLLERNADYGRERVFSERWRATGRRRNAEVLNLRGLKLEEETKEKKKPIVRTPEELAMLAVAQSQGWLIGLANSFTVTGLERGLTGEPLADFVVENVAGASDGALDNAALRASRNAIQAGRFDAYATLAPEIRMWYRHEFDDDHTCDACLEGSGDAYYSLEEIDWWPGKDCEGGRMCRGELVESFQDEGKYEWGK